MSSAPVTVNTAEIQKLDEASKRDITNYIEVESAKQKVQMSVHQFTSMCFRNCVKDASNPELSSAENQCLNSCVNRFLDTNIKIVKGLQNIQ
ncbi:hypothetical protein ACO0QE_001768 [Hanseniaspora vineae]